MTLLVMLFLLLRYVVSSVTTIVPSGRVHTVVTCTAMSTAGFNLTMQVSVTLEPIGWIGFGLLLITSTEAGGGTVGEN